MSKQKSAVAQMIVAMRSEPTSIETLMVLSGMSESAVAGWVKTLRAYKLVRIGDWFTDARGYHTIPAYHWAPGQPDVHCPTKSSTERVREWRERQKGNK